MDSKLTRRNWAAYFAALPLLAQQPQAPLPAKNEEADSARDRIVASSTELAAFSIPMSTEPAFQFKA